MRIRRTLPCPWCGHPMAPWVPHPGVVAERPEVAEHLPEDGDGVRCAQCNLICAFHVVLGTLGLRKPTPEETREFIELERTYGSARASDVFPETR